ncbi:MAG TPA: zinc ribbon domain-containing protein [Candidatus Glassbacteria bacterium]|nr:zinc ribbon domain-containing protein [Candidatus Glassbacteria bacterium]
MVFKKNFIAVVQVNGKPLREGNGNVLIPFGSEYSIYLKNLESRDAVVDVSIDGKDVLDGNSIVVKANSSTELHGYMDGSVVRKRFKFIPMTEKIEEYRGIKPEDGLVRVEFRFEKEITPIQYTMTVSSPSPTWTNPYPPTCRWEDGPYTISKGETFLSSDSSIYASYLNTSRQLKGVESISSIYVDANPRSITMPVENGITVPGSETNQQFTPTYIGALESESHVIVLQLVGRKEDETRVMKPVFTREKITCPTCGTRNSTRVNFCGECGTNLK